MDGTLCFLLLLLGELSCLALPSYDNAGIITIVLKLSVKLLQSSSIVIYINFLVCYVFDTVRLI